MEIETTQVQDSSGVLLSHLSNELLLELFPAITKPNKWLPTMRECGLLEQFLRIVLLSQECRNSGIEENETLGSWRSRRWKGLVEEAFIAQRQRFEKVSYYQLNVPERGLAMELYYQLCNGETCFENLLREYMPTKPEKPQKGIIIEKPLASVPAGLVKKLKKNRPGVPIEPMVIGNAVSLIQLIEWHPPVLDGPTRQILQQEAEEMWLGKELHRRLQLVQSGERGKDLKPLPRHQVES